MYVCGVGMRQPEGVAKRRKEETFTWGCYAEDASVPSLRGKFLDAGARKSLRWWVSIRSKEEREERHHVLVKQRRQTQSLSFAVVGVYPLAGR